MYVFSRHNSSIVIASSSSQSFALLSAGMSSSSSHRRRMKKLSRPGIRMAAAAAFVAGIIMPHDVTAFGVKRSKTLPKQHKTILPVIVYSGEDYHEEENSWKSDSATTGGVWGSAPTSADLFYVMERISSKCAQSLTRLACAFSPGGSLHLKDVKSAHIVDMDASHMEISAVLCETQGCVQVPVAVPFPAVCYDSGNAMVECVLENIERLDVQAHQKIEQDEWNEDHSEELRDQQRNLYALQAEPNPGELPHWWTYPQLHYQGATLSGECADIKHLLNEDEFASELAALLAKHRSRTDYDSWMGKEVVVARACVASIGPSGLILRAKIAGRATHDHQSSTAGDVVLVPIAFDKEANSCEELKTLVLDLVSSVMTDKN